MAKSVDEYLAVPVSAEVLWREEELRKVISGTTASDADKLRLALRAFAVASMSDYFRHCASVIFGSQLKFLMHFSTTQTNPTRAQLEAGYATIVESNPELHKNRSFDDWLQFLLDSGLVTVDGEHIALAQRGIDFITYLVEKRLLSPRAG